MLSHIAHFIRIMAAVKNSIESVKADAATFRKRIDNLKKMVEDHERCLVALRRANATFAQIQCHVEAERTNARLGVQSPDVNSRVGKIEKTSSLHTSANPVNGKRTVVADDCSITDDCSWYTLASIGSARINDNKMRGQVNKMKTKCKIDEGFSLHEMYGSNVVKPVSLHQPRLGLFMNDKMRSQFSSFESHHRSPDMHQDAETMGSKIAPQLSEMTTESDSTSINNDAIVGRKKSSKRAAEKRQRLLRLRQRARLKEKRSDTIEDSRILRTCSSLSVTSGLGTASTYLGSYNVVG